MKNLKQILFGTIIAALLVGCGGGTVKDSGTGAAIPMPTKPVKAEKPKHTGPAYELDYAYFTKNGLPIPDAFRGPSIEYLSPGRDVVKESGYDFFNEYDENLALTFYKDLNVRGYGDNSNYWRWKVTFSSSDFKNAIAKGLISTYQSKPNVVLTLVGNSWQSRPISRSDIGDIKKVEVAARGKSGIIAYLAVITSKNKYLIAKEYNVRKILAPGSRGLYGAMGGQGAYGSSPFRTGLSMLPSAYCAFEEKGDNVTIYGGGNGHGAGLPQFSASALTNDNGYSYKEVLKRYYPGSEIEDMYKIKGVTKNIRVGITSGGSVDHSKVTLGGSGKTVIKGSGVNISVPANQKIEVTNSKGQLNIKVAGKQRAKTSGTVRINGGGRYLTLYGIRKSHTSNPSYRGIIELRPASGRVRIINEVYIEDYLKQVLPSEMPKSFGVEALKAQAVAARTYALSDYLKFRYQNLGFHVKDTVESQVYNNQAENDESNQAIKATEGKVLLYDGSPIDAKYFSTSSGFTEAGNYIW